MSLVLPREEEVENIFSRILSSDRSCERLVETFYNHLCDDERYIDPDPRHFAEVILNAYKNGDVSALLLEICGRSMFDLLKEAYLIPRRFHGKSGINPVLLTDPEGNLLEDKKSLATKHEFKKFREIYDSHLFPGQISILPTATPLCVITPPAWTSVRKRRTGNGVYLCSTPFPTPRSSILRRLRHMMLYGLPSMRYRRKHFQPLSTTDRKLEQAMTNPLMNWACCFLYPSLSPKCVNKSV